MDTLTVKEKVLQAVNELPDDTTYEEAIERLYFLRKLERGIAQADAGEKITHAEAKQRLARWRE